MITVPPQKQNKTSDIVFSLKINENNTLAFNMLPGLLFFFSAKFLSHRQASSRADPAQVYKPFFNFSSNRTKFFCQCIDILFKEISWKRGERGRRERSQEEEGQQKQGSMKRIKNRVNMRKN